MVRPWTAAGCVALGLAQVSELVRLAAGVVVVLAAEWQTVAWCILEETWEVLEETEMRLLITALLRLPRGAIDLKPTLPSS